MDLSERCAALHICCRHSRASAVSSKSIRAGLNSTMASPVNLSVESINEESIAQKSKIEPYPFWTLRSARFRLTLVMMVGILGNSLVRNSLSMAMVCMVNTTAIYGEKRHLNETNSDGCKLEQSDEEDYGGTLVWDSQQQGYLFAALYWGGVISGLPAGYLADRYNPKLLIFWCLLINAIGCLLTPVAAVKGGMVPVLVLRVLMGLGGQSTIFPPMAAITARWIPPTDRSKVIAIYTAGSQIASVIGSPLNAFLCSKKNFMGGWPSIFYVTGFLTVPTVILWLVAVSNGPEKTRWISEKEKIYIQTSLGEVKKKVHFREVPWKKLLTSMAVMAAVFGNFSLSAMNTVLTSYIPIYFKESLKMDLASNGLLGSLPFISQWLGKIFFSQIADLLIARTSFSPTRVCRIFNMIGSFGVAIFLIACGYMKCTQIALAVTFMTISNGLFACQVPGLLTSLVSIAPAYSGIVQALSRFVGQIASVIAPYVVGAITVNGTSMEWRTVFLIIGGAMIVSELIFMIWGSADVQEWAKPAPPPPVHPIPAVITVDEALGTAGMKGERGTVNNSFVSRISDRA